MNNNSLKQNKTIVNALTGNLEEQLNLVTSIENKDGSKNRSMDSM